MNDGVTFLAIIWLGQSTEFIRLNSTIHSSKWVKCVNCGKSMDIHGVLESNARLVCPGEIIFLSTSSNKYQSMMFCCPLKTFNNYYARVRN